MQKLAPPLYLVFCMFTTLLAQNPSGDMDVLTKNDTIFCNAQKINVLLMLDLTIMHGVPIKSAKELVILFLVYAQHQLLLTGIIR